MKDLFRRLLTESADMLHRLSKRLEEKRPGDQVIEEEEEMPLPEHPLARHVSPLVFRENRKAIEQVLAKRGFRKGDTIQNLLEESRQ